MIIQRFRIVFAANGKHEIHIYVFLRNVQSNITLAFHMQFAFPKDFRK